jgi:hypothetical protein
MKQSRFPAGWDEARVRRVLAQIEVGLRTPGEVEMKAGLSKVDVVVIEGQTRLRDGAAIAAVGPEKGQRLWSCRISASSALAAVMSLMVVLLGIMAYERLPVREYPNIDTPVVSVRTAYRGASSEVIALELAALADRFRSPQSRRKWAQKR